MSFDNITKSNIGLGTGVSSLAILLILFISGNMTGTVESLTDDLSNHIGQEAHPVAKERLTQILDKVHDIEKEMEDNEKQMKQMNKELFNIKIIICTNSDFNCIRDLQ